MEVVNNRGAVVAQLVEQLIRNEQVAGSTPVNGSIFCVICDTGFSSLISLLGLSWSWSQTPLPFQERDSESCSFGRIRAQEGDLSLPISSLGLWLLALQDVNFSIIFRNATRRVVVLTELVKCSQLMAYGGSSIYDGLHTNVTYIEIINCTGPLTHCNSCQNYNGPNRFYVSENNREVDWS